jgi:hypothetical protein
VKPDKREARTCDREEFFIEVQPDDLLPRPQPLRVPAGAVRVIEPGPRRWMAFKHQV